MDAPSLLRRPLCAEGTGHGYGVRRAPDYDKRPIPTERSLAREHDALLWRLDLEDAIAELEADAADSEWDRMEDAE
jgi:hypothetical protein